jgi:hypothetical protein
MCSPEVRKEANRYFWIIKGHLIPQQEPDYIVESYYDNYFKRLWNNESGCMELYEAGFEEAYEQRVQELLTEEMKNVARLGYD